MSANKVEIENFDKYAYEWWNKRGPYKLLHNLTPLRLKYIQDQVDLKNNLPASSSDAITGGSELN